MSKLKRSKNKEQKTVFIAHEDQATFSKIFHISPMGMAISRMSDNKFIEVNEAFLQIFGYSRKEILGHSSKEFGLWPIREERQKMLLELRKNGLVRNFEAKMRRKSGEVGDLLISSELINLNGQECLLGCLIDNTRRKTIERELLERDARFSFLFNNTINGIAFCQMIFDGVKPKDFIYLSVNKAFEELTGLKGVDGKKVTEVIPDFDKLDADLLEIYGRVARTGKSEILEKYVNSLKMWFNLSVYSPNFNYFVVTFDVITQRKNTEIALQEKNIALREILEQVQVEKNKIREYVQKNVHEMILPQLNKMRLKNSSKEQVDLLEKMLLGLTSSFGHSITQPGHRLSPRELEVSSMIKEGLTSKEIANLLNISSQTVDKHRKNMRRKLNIVRKGINSQSHLNSI